MKYILIILLFISCGTRKTDTQYHEDLNIQNNYSEGAKIVLGNSFKYVPFDNAKPMTIEGKEYVNAIVSNDKSQTFETYKHFNIYHHFNIDERKQTEKKDDTILWICIVLGSLLIIGCLIWLWFYLPKFKTGI